jgi:hypothetical protein
MYEPKTGLVDLTITLEFLDKYMGYSQLRKFHTHYNIPTKAHTLLQSLYVLYNAE